MKTVICHFFNEEWILPWWLKHHREIFEHGIMIDYQSTDRSTEIIKELCPDWQIIPSKNNDFGAMNVDLEVEEIIQNYFSVRNNTTRDWVMCLNVTEFLYGRFDLLSTEAKAQIIIPAHMMVSKTRATYYSYDVSLTEHVKTGIPWYGQMHGGERAGRTMHDHPISYPKPGRHYFVNEDQLSKDFVIFHYGWGPMCPQLLKRKLQIQTRIPEYDRQNQLGWHHITDENSLLSKWTDQYIPKAVDLSQEIQKWVELTDKPK